MGIFSGDFLQNLRNEIIDIIKNAVETLVQQQKIEKRYLKQKDARTYIGGIDHAKFREDVVLRGKVPEIRINGSLRYDIKDLDDFMAKHKH